MIYGFMPLHYGSQFLKAALKSVEPYVDKYVVSYTEIPSYGFNSDLKCPDSKDSLKQICENVLGDKLIWLEGKYRNEGQHRDTVFRYASNDDLIIVTDSDEIWKDAGKAIEEAKQKQVFSLRINGFVNFWKSLDYIVRDGFQPVRILQPKYSRNSSDVLDATIYHLGYMINEETMKYKLAIHGHRNDIDQVHGSPDNYFNKWKRWSEPNCGVNLLHPASRDVWKDAENYNGEKPII